MIIEEFSKIQVLNEIEVKKWADKVHSLKDIWVPKKVTKDINIFILGTATYLDYNEDLSIEGKKYIKNRYKYYNKKYREDLINTFQPLYDRVISALSINLNIQKEKIRLSKKLAPPGFHIISSNLFPNNKGLMYGGKIHYDKTHLNHSEEYPKLDNSSFNTLSFTLPIQLPKCKSGMYVWDYLPNKKMVDLAINLDEENFKWVDKNKKEVLYKVGEMVVHSGGRPHQLAKLDYSDENEWRITLQGHGILSDGFLDIYF